MALIDTLKQIITEVGQAWDDSGPLHILIALVVPLVAWMARKPLANFVIKLFSALGKNLGFDLSDAIKESASPPIRVLVVVFGLLVAHENIQLPEPYFGFMEKLLVSISVAVVFSVVYSACQYIPQYFENRQNTQAPDQLGWVVHVAQFVVVFVGIAAVFKVWGIDVGPVLTGMGLAGAAVALAAQDFLMNLLAGFNNAAERRFNVGDWIRVEGMVEGTVESVDLRSTVIRRFDKAPVHVPNSVLANKLLINFSRRPHRRIDWTISLTYDTSIDTLRMIRERVEQYIDDSDQFYSPGLTDRYVRIDAFTDSSINIQIVCFSQSNVKAEYLKAKEDLALAIKSIVAEAGGSFAFPSRSIYMQTSSGEESANHSGADNLSAGE